LPKPRVSVAIPTFQRAPILAETLARLPKGPFEFIVSDNASTDGTWGVLEAAQKADKRIIALGQTENKGTFANTVSAFAAASTPFVVYMPDDDSILAEPLLEHVKRLEKEPDLVAIYTDSIAWDDAQETEMHRYYPPNMPAQVFGPEHNLEIADFLLKSHIPPEIGVFRKEAALKVRVPTAKAMPYHQWAYAFTRLGRVRFDPLAFLKEHRILKPHLKREYWGNMDDAWAYIGDEQRLGFEALYLWALRDANIGFLADWRRLQVFDNINQMLLDRTTLEIRRACERGDFILGVELRRRQVLYSTNDLDHVADHNGLTVKAAEQAKAQGAEGTMEDLIEAYRIGYGYTPQDMRNFQASIDEFMERGTVG
jgi:teichuronic acid biosynthesis glycosyltransferase TuaG